MSATRKDLGNDKPQRKAWEPFPCPSSRHRAIARLLAQMFVAISLRRHCRDLAKQRREVTLILKAGAQPDLDYRQFAIDQQPFGEIDPAVGQELNRSRAGGLFERPREVERTQFSYLGDFGQRQIVFEVFFDEFGHAAQFMFRQSAEMVLESFAASRIMPEHMGHQRVDQRFGVNRPRGRPGVYFGGQRSANLMNQRVDGFAVGNEVDAVGLNELSSLTVDIIRIEVDYEVLKLLFPIRRILLAHGHYARLADGSGFVNDLTADPKHRSFV